MGPAAVGGPAFPGRQYLITSAGLSLKFDNNSCPLERASQQRPSQENTDEREGRGFWMVLPQSLVPFLSTAMPQDCHQAEGEAILRGERVGPSETW